MGYCLETHCAGCGRERTYRLGQGLKDCNLDRVLGQFEHSEAEQIKNMLQADGNGLWNFQRSLGVCPNCQDFFEVPVFSMFSNENDTAEENEEGAANSSNEMNEGETRLSFSGEKHSKDLNAGHKIIRRCQCGNFPKLIPDPENAKLTCTHCGHVLEQKISGFWD